MFASCKHEFYNCCRSLFDVLAELYCDDRFFRLPCVIKFPLQTIVTLRLRRFRDCPATTRSDRELFLVPIDADRGQWMCGDTLGQLDVYGARGGGVEKKSCWGELSYLPIAAAVAAAYDRPLVTVAKPTPTLIVYLSVAA